MFVSIDCETENTSGGRVDGDEKFQERLGFIRRKCRWGIAVKWHKEKPWHSTLRDGWCLRWCDSSRAYYSGDASRFHENVTLCERFPFNFPKLIKNSEKIWSEEFFLFRSIFPRKFKIFLEKGEGACLIAISGIDITDNNWIFEPNRK